MQTNRSLASPRSQPHPGEIWEISHRANGKIEQDSIAENQSLTRYAAIVREPQSLSETLLGTRRFC